MKLKTMKYFLFIHGNNSQQDKQYCTEDITKTNI